MMAFDDMGPLAPAAKSANFVYRVMRNADSMEGRGPMVYVATFDTFPAANTYVMHKSGEGKAVKVQRSVDGTRWSYGSGHEVHKDEVLQEFNPKQVEADKKELKELEERAEVLRALTKL